VRSRHCRAARNYFDFVKAQMRETLMQPDCGQESKVI
jgi:hypothetical protein